MLVGFVFDICELKYTCGTAQGWMLAMQMSQLVFKIHLSSSSQSHEKAKCYHMCDNTSFPNCPSFAKQKHSPCWGRGRKKKRLWGGGNVHTQVTALETKSSSEQILQVIFPEAEEVIQILVVVFLLVFFGFFFGNKQCAFVNQRTHFFSSLSYRSLRGS